MINSINVLQVLIENGANINECNTENVSPLIISALSGNKECSDFLIYKGCDITIQNMQGLNALDCAVVNGYYNQALSLLNTG